MKPSLFLAKIINNDENEPRAELEILVSGRLIQRIFG